MNMEVPEISMISDFEAGMKCLQNPSLISRFFSFSSIEKVPHVYSLRKWGALIFALLATFSSIIKRIKLFFIYFHTVKLSLHENEEVEISEDDEISLTSSDDEDDDKGGEGEGEGEGEENSPTTSLRGQRRIDEDFCVKGLKKQGQNDHLRQRRCSKFTFGKNVVKLWDSLGLNIAEDFINNDSKGESSIWDFDQDREKCDFSGSFWNIPAVSVASPAMFLTAEANGKGDGVVLGGYDTRIRRRVPALYAEWRLPVEEIAGIATGGVNNKVYVRDNVNGILTVGDVRNIRMPLSNTQSDDGTLTPLLWSLNLS